MRFLGVGRQGREPTLQPQCRLLDQAIRGQGRRQRQRESQPDSHGRGLADQPIVGPSQNRQVPQVEAVRDPSETDCRPPCECSTRAMLPRTTKP